MKDIYLNLITLFHATIIDLMEWVLDIQLGRQNLSPIQRIAVAEKYRPIYEKRAKEKQSEAGGDKKSEDFKKSVTQNFVEAKNNRSDNETNAKLAKIANVNRETYRQAKRVLDSDNEDLKKKLLLVGTKKIFFKNFHFLRQFLSVRVFI